MNEPTFDLRKPESDLKPSERDEIERQILTAIEECQPIGLVSNKMVADNTPYFGIASSRKPTIDRWLTILKDKGMIAFFARTMDGSYFVKLTGPGLERISMTETEYQNRSLSHSASNVFNGPVGQIPSVPT